MAPHARAPTSHPHTDTYGFTLEELGASRLHHTTSGFTIVELLIVIVIIAILAAISIVAYTGIQQRASNAAIASAARQVQNTINAYVTLEGRHPTQSTNICLTLDNLCSSGGISATTSNEPMVSALASVGTLPSSVPTDQGLRYSFATYRQMADGTPVPALIVYVLPGNAQDCGIQVVAGTQTATSTPTTA